MYIINPLIFFLIITRFEASDVKICNNIELFVKSYNRKILYIYVSNKKNNTGYNDT